MSTTREPDHSSETPFAPVPAGDDPRRGQEVFAPTDGPFEAPAKTFVEGPYYKGVEERLPDLAQRSESDGESPKARAFSVDRRDLLKLFSASAVAGTAACVQRPVEKAIPFVNQPTDTWPGEPVHFATTCGECSAGCGVMARTREGRPTKLEGLPEHPVNTGSLCTVGQASLQALFHPERQARPTIRFGSKIEPSEWNDVFENFAAKLTSPKIGILTNGSTGHRHGFFKEFLEKVGSSADKLYTYDSNSLAEATAEAHKIAYGLHAVPRSDLSKAKVIVGVGADFLDVGTSLLYNTKTYTEGHSFRGADKSKHVQFESFFTLTGARSDYRHPIAPGSETVVTLLLVNSLLKNSAVKGSAAARSQAQAVLSANAALLSGAYDRVGYSEANFDKLAEEMLASQSVVLAGGSAFDENATTLQLAAILANELVGAYETVLFLQKDWLTAPVATGDLQRFMTESRDIDVLFLIDVDPVFTLPPSWGVGEVLEKIPTVAVLCDFPNESSQYAKYVLNTHHWLESWGDEQSVAGLWSVRQPVVRPTTDSRQTEDILMWIAAYAKKPLGYENYRAYLKKKWDDIRTLVGRNDVPADNYFDLVLQHGYDGRNATQVVPDLSGNLASSFRYTDTGSGGLRLVAPLDYRLRDGRHAWKPALQETPDSLTTITWDTWVAINPVTTAKLGLRKFDVVKVEGPAGSFEASVYPLPGLHPDTVVVPRGNGHSKANGTVQGGNGVNPLVAFARAQDQFTGAPVTYGQQVKLTATGRVFELAQTQKHNDIANRKDIIKEVPIATAVANMGKTQDLDDVPNLYPAMPKQQHRWGMSIDLSKCTGCSACVVACTIENNVPQVGREQVLLGRQMHWMQIDRYFAGSVEAPEVTFQPMLCQHCAQAPCEGVCPVFATSHDPEGINQMTYNRCIGTRYCANACPYKIRRFNWWTHRWNTMGARLTDRNPRALNPDVTVRTRGVMEKCSFCYQRVRDARHKEKLNGIPVGQPGNVVKTACQQTCPAEAIAFGNLLDPAAPVTQQRKDLRAYLALNGEPSLKEYGLKTMPSVNYLAKVSFTAKPAHHGAHGGDHGEAGHGEQHGARPVEKSKKKG
ncbi:MAG: 4Fe-4S dicluster domain-containing protein [Deltaproteobacteria bacterium]|nr:4Fe-4S dicluster domain-containing protein [Deltaproteobacteria bacterium]